ncbi:magnesium-protoporphyrin IX monomethyl ester anaerobic oxidative cyclase [Adonisia turfae]|uniref:Magnesium-protoporphyrin IX monomethyl ester anaerobic oxidative cyclase n=1 Tax=Adonisia turfae CCMR0081 TaxID=2292702 RepID=A0A6M0RIU7_9CYAN|nr:magnesium-protoporphyrin IX monomethyl ester anaerobic oxidative cyclase [Adonisia turfae]NEZ56116.1 magnesium-protoporphyrin IX monomethyl ester anaerobic oxidative cyclase [Adonisia turfae CCMR0081]
MRILIVNPPHPAIGSRIPREQLPPLGLLCVGGALLDAGHDVTLLDAELGPLSNDEIVQQVVTHSPQVLLIGHSGSTSAHPIVVDLTLRFRQELPSLTIVYGGVFPTYHFHDILTQESQIDVIVRGEGEATVPKLMAAIEEANDLANVEGIAFRRNNQIIETLPALMIQDLDAYRIGWELVDLKNYSYYGGKQAVVIQFSRGCPHLCNYCGQRGFWARWRHRNPKKFAKEIAWLHRTHGVELFNLADENPTVNKAIWRELCEAIIAENLQISIIGSTRADDIVRDADILHLYRQAGVERFLLGMENTDEVTLKAIRKGSKTSTDREAIRLLRQHGILSLATWVTDFEEVTDYDFIRSLKQLLWYDPDQLMSLYVTPHRWTGYYRIASERRIIQPDQRKWDYKHQVLETRYMPPWRIFLWVKFIEIVLQARPKALWRSFLQPDRAARHGMNWFTRMGRRVIVHEFWNFLFHDSRIINGPTLREFWGVPQDHQEIPLRMSYQPMKHTMPIEQASSKVRS